MKHRIVSAALPVLIGMAAWVYLSGERREEADSDVLAGAVELVSQVEGYAERSEYIDDLVTRAHQEAFRFAYREGTPDGSGVEQEAASFRKDKYLQWLFANMRQDLRKGLKKVGKRQAQSDRELMNALDALRKKLDIANPTGV